ncbi:DUF6658 family protein [Argonema antarcticum]|uniref:DUF6658 family protein n=1 Tax=Argonema antarcticum TaxID=2942763 RepID=UPI002012F685|nr:DUF6658 family protein [Argonema antarcticum]MCL1473884.1 hypothetical protein [Argonema antarcticum A004/B2]
MNNAISLIKRLNFVQVLTVFFAGIILFVSTACGSPSVQAKGLNNPRLEVPKEAVTNNYEGGMNDYSDVDPRLDTSAANKKADRLIESAEHNLTARTGNPAEAIKRAVNDAPDSAKEAGRNVNQAAGNFADKAADSAKDFAAGTRRGVENIKENTQDAAKDVAKSAEKAKHRAGEAADNTKETLDKVFNKDMD